MDKSKIPDLIDVARLQASMHKLRIKGSIRVGNALLVFQVETRKEDMTRVQKAWFDGVNDLLDALGSSIVYDGYGYR